MIQFNGIHSDSFGHTSVTSWRDKFYTDFDRKEITYRGLLRAAVEVPTIRNIETDFLVRGRNKQEVFEKLERISEWLRSAGVAKLISDRAPSRYYKARCTSISKPEYSGLSARFTVTFSCADHRIYSLRTDLPLKPSQEDLSNFTFAGLHCLNDMGCVFVEESRDITPAVRANKYVIAGNDGTVRFTTGKPVLEEVTYSGILYLVNDQSADGLLDESAISMRIKSIASWLINAERSALVMDADVTREYQAEVIDAAPFDRKGWENGIIKIKFILQPVSKDITAKTKVQNLTLAAGIYQSISLASLVTDGVGFETPLSISVKNTGAANITDLYVHYFDGKNVGRYARFNGNGFSLPPLSTLVISGDNQSIMIGSTDGLKWFKTGDFPVLSPNGTKSISIKTANASSVEVTISFNVRWLG